MRIAVTLALLTVAAPVVALPYATSSFHHQPTGFYVEVSHDGSDMVLDGTNPASHERFHLVVNSRGRVTGVYKGERVDYVTGQPAPASAVVAAN